MAGQVQLTSTLRKYRCATAGNGETEAMAELQNRGKVASLAIGNATATQGTTTMLDKLAMTTTAVSAAAAVTHQPQWSMPPRLETPRVPPLVHNMYNKDEETDPGWEEEISAVPASVWEDQGGVMSKNPG
jgi:hypothetical protein